MFQLDEQRDTELMDRGVHNTHDSRKTIVLFSPDIDLCMSLRLLFQDQYHMVTTTDPEMIVTLSHTFQPELLIVDALPTKRMCHRFEELRKELPKIQIMLFYVSTFNDKQIRNAISQTSDAAFSKPLDLGEVTQSIRSLILRPSP